MFCPSSAVRDKVRHVVVQLDHGLVEGGKPGSTSSRELGQVGVGDLAMADDPRNGNIGVRDVIRPEFVPCVRGGLVEDRSCRGGRRIWIVPYLPFCRQYQVSYAKSWQAK